MGEQSALWKRLAVGLYALPFVLILAALIPLNFGFVPYRVADAWQHVRVELAIFGAVVLVVEGLIYVAFGLG